MAFLREKIFKFSLRFLLGVWGKYFTNKRDKLQMNFCVCVHICLACQFSVANKKEPEPVDLFRDSAHIFISVLLKPLTATVIIRKNFFDFRIEFCGMIHLFSVAEFVNNNAVDDFIRQQNKQTVEVKIAFSTITVQTVSSHSVRICLLFFNVRMCRKMALSFVNAVLVLLSTTESLS